MSASLGPLNHLGTSETAAPMKLLWDVLHIDDIRVNSYLIFASGFKAVSLFKFYKMYPYSQTVRALTRLLLSRCLACLCIKINKNIWKDYVSPTDRSNLTNEETKAVQHKLVESKIDRFSFM